MLRRLLVLVWAAALAAQIPAHAQNEKVIRGFDGGMMVHTGYLFGNIGPEEFPAKGVPFGIGGVIRLHLGKHLRLGSEGYVSTLNQRKNGSYLKYGWGGILVDAYTVWGHFQPYIGITAGGGAATTLLMDETPSEAWAPVDGTVYNRAGFFAIDPYLGVDFIVGKAMHLTLKVDWLNCFTKGGAMLPSGPRVYFGFLFYH